MLCGNYADFILIMKEPVKWTRYLRTRIVSTCVRHNLKGMNYGKGIVIPRQTYLGLVFRRAWGGNEWRVEPVIYWARERA